MPIKKPLEVKRDVSFGLDSYYKDRQRERVLLRRIRRAALSLVLIALTAAASYFGGTH